MRARTLTEIQTTKGIISAGQIIEIPSAVIEKLKGKVEPLHEPAMTPPMSEGRRKTLGMIADAILTQAVIDIDYGGIWQSTPDVKALEDEINRLYRLLTEGLTTLAAFKAMVNQWQSTGTQITKH